MTVHVEGCLGPWAPLGPSSPLFKLKQNPFNIGIDSIEPIFYFATAAAGSSRQLAVIRRSVHRDTAVKISSPRVCM
jgi:hypothetical protein